MDQETFNSIKFLQDAYGFTEQAATDLVSEYHTQHDIKDLFEFIRAKQSIEKRL